MAHLTGLGLLFLIVFVFEGNANFMQNSELSEDCDFYDTVEAHGNMRCGMLGYPIDFGKRLCRELTLKKRVALTQNGGKWAESVVRCMRQNLNSILDNSNCGDLTPEKLDHASCYYAGDDLCSVRQCPLNRFTIATLPWTRSSVWNESYAALTEANARCPTKLYDTANVGGMVVRFVPQKYITGNTDCLL
ncbi:unnamed protein product [Owenia fusiformis]|uniref:Uncharacterized protein n=1 Tax=Owenia fusiformis TaxID=6347 RepID=A0A8S4Q8V0_OWEFU|nr:unnamed protein product [Owenia fusiformis]